MFFVAVLSGAGVFNLLHSLVGGILLFIVGLIAAQRATKYGTEILRVLLNSAKFRLRYDRRTTLPCYMLWQKNQAIPEFHCVHFVSNVI